jgi:hypothetical protein
VKRERRDTELETGMIFMQNGIHYGHPVHNPKAAKIKAAI